MKNFLIIPDKFKGSIDAIQVSKAVKNGLQRLYGDHFKSTVIPASDGGDGFLDTIYNFKPVKKVYFRSVDAFQYAIDSYYLLDVETNTAYIELANTVGIRHLQSNELNILKTSTHGVGLQIAHALDAGVRSIYIGLGGSFAPWVGALISNINQKIIFIAEEGREQEVVTRFSRVGYDNILGYLRGGIHSWKAAGHKVDQIGSMSATQFANSLKEGSMGVALDVRKESEYLSEHVVDVENFPLDDIHTNFAEINPDKEYFLHCASGYRSLIAASIFQANGVKKVTDVRGGFKDIKDTGVALTDYVCPTTLL